MYVSQHALQRYRIHHPAADADAALLAVNAGEPLARELAAQLLGRHTPGGERTEHFVLVPDRKGVFVVSLDRPPSLVTYLRFGPAQEALALRLWPRPETAGPTVADPPPMEVPESRPSADPAQGGVTVATWPAVQSRNDARVPVLGDVVRLVLVEPTLAARLGGANAVRRAVAGVTAPEVRGTDRGEPTLHFALPDATGAPVRVRVHRVQGRLVVDLEPPPSDRPDPC